MRLPRIPPKWKPLSYLKWEERRLMKKRRLLDEKLRKKYSGASSDIDDLQTTENYLETFKKAKRERRWQTRRQKKSITESVKAGEKFVRTIQRHLKKREEIISRLEEIRAKIGKRQRRKT